METKKPDPILTFRRQAKFIHVIISFVGGGAGSDSLL
jgi:hypothetical protein